MLGEVSAKLSKAGGNCHSGQAKRDPEPRIYKEIWIPAFAGMTEQATFAGALGFIHSFVHLRRRLSALCPLQLHSWWSKLKSSVYKA